MRTFRAPNALACAVAALAWATTAAPQGAAPAPPDKEACASAHEQAQVARKRGKLIEARAKLQLCASDACPILARQDCSVWLVEVEERVPTIVLSARDARGAPSSAVKCTLDGEPFVDKLDGAPIAINPGAHALKCELDGAFVEQPIAVVEGEKGRRVDLTFEPPAPAPSASALVPPPPSASASSAPPVLPPPPREASPAVYALAGLAVLGLGGFAYFGLTGLNDETNLRNTCHASCNPSDVSAVTTKYHVADVSLAIGVVAAGVAGWLYLSRPAAGAPQSGARIGVTAMPGGGGARVELRF